MKFPIFIAVSLVCVPLSRGAISAFYSQTGAGATAPTNAEQWGGGNFTNFSSAFDLTFDYTAAVAAVSNPILLWEAGGSGTGSVLVLHGSQLHYFAGNSTDDVVSGSHGLSAGMTDIQIVTAFQVDAGTGTNELLSIYVNGSLIVSGDVNTANDWSGGEAGSAVGQTSGTQRYVGTGLFTDSSVVNYAGPAISFDAYRLAPGNGPADADNTLANILVPEPSSSLLFMLGGATFFFRRRK